MGKHVLIGRRGLLSKALQACQNFSELIVTSTDLSSSAVYYDSCMSLFEINVDWEEVDSIIVTSAISNVLACERDSEHSLAINLDWPLRIAKDAKSLMVPVVFFSSEYVFDGLSPEPYDENSATNPTTVYGYHKSLLEEQVMTEGNGNLVFRISKLADINNPRSFLGKMKDEINKADVYYAATDQIFSPISIKDAAALIHKATQHKLSGLFNLSGPDTISRYMLAKKIAACCSASTKIVPIKIRDLDLGYDTPSDLGMCSNRLSSTLDMHISSGVDF